MQSIGDVYSTKVPSPQEAADINKAFNYYHYGQAEAPTSESQVVITPAPTSIAGWLKYLQTQITTLNEGISNVTTLTSIQNLDDIKSTKFYVSTSSPTTALKYPVARVGFLNVVAKGDLVYQTYQTIKNDDGETNANADAFYWRSGKTVVGTTTWSAWVKASDTTHNHNDIYYSKNELNAKILWETLTASRAAIVNAEGKLQHGNVTTTELNTLSGIGTVTLANQLLNKSDTTHKHDDRYYIRPTVTDGATGAQKTQRVFVQDPALGNPSGAAVGDLWFW